MYDNPTAAAAAGTLGSGTLALTGVDVMWLVLAAFALLAAGLALVRIVPRFRQGPTRVSRAEVIERLKS